MASGDLVGEVRLRLLHDGAPPIHDAGEPFVFGLQLGRDDIQPGTTLGGGGVAFDFTLRVKPGADPDRPVFLGPAAQGPAGERFVYLSWKAALRPGFINRIKAQLGGVTADQVRRAQESGGAITADISGRRPHDTRPVTWTVSAPGDQVRIAS